MVAMDFFAALNSYDFFNQYCSNLLKNPTVRGLRRLQIGKAKTGRLYYHIFFSLIEKYHTHDGFLTIQAAIQTSGARSFRRFERDLASIRVRRGQHQSSEEVFWHITYKFQPIALSSDIPYSALLVHSRPLKLVRDSTSGLISS